MPWNSFPRQGLSTNSPSRWLGPCPGQLPMNGLIFGVLVTCAGTLAQATERPVWVLAVGEQRLLSLPGLSRYSLGGPNVRAHSQKDSLLVKGVREGVSDLWIWKADGSSEHRTIQVEKELRLDLKP